MADVDVFGLREEWLACKDWSREALQAGYEGIDKYVEAEAKYQAMKYEVALSLKEEGYPVTFINTIIKGHPLVNPLLKERDRTEMAARLDPKAVDVALTQERETFKDYDNALRGM